MLCRLILGEINNNGYGLVNIPSIKPLNNKILINILKRYDKIITVEDHGIFGGLGSIVGELIAQNNLSIKFKIHGLKTGFIDSDIPSNLEKKYQMDIKSLKKIFLNF